MNRPAMPNGCALMNCQSAFGRFGTVSASAAVAIVAMASCPLVQPNAGVEPAVEQVDHQIDEDEAGRDEEDETLNEIEVTARGGVDKELADAVDVEHLLGHHQAADQERELKTDDGDDRQQGVAQGMPTHDQPGPYPFGPGGADVVLTHDFEQ